MTRIQRIDRIAGPLLALGVAFGTGIVGALWMADPAYPQDAPPVPRAKPEQTAPAPRQHAPAAMLQMMCGDRAAIVGAIEGPKHVEQRTGVGLASGGQLLELFASERGSWTVLMSEPTGRSCIVGAGEGWTAFEITTGEEV